jgi:hypothetical protein
MRAESHFAVNVAGFFRGYSFFVFTAALCKESVPIPAESRSLVERFL